MAEKGDLVVDTSRNRVGRIMEKRNVYGRGTVYALRPPRGGIEWDVPANKCRPPEPHELVSADSLKHVECR